MAEQQFDVFLCHNSEDKPAVIQIAQQLRTYRLKPWLDVWELQPGGIWQFDLEQQIESINAAAVFVGQQGLGPWQSEEIYALLQEFIRRKCPVIPVMLHDAPKQPRLPIFLKNRHWVDFRQQEPDPLAQLVWGITGKRPESFTTETAEKIPIQEQSATPPSSAEHVVYTSPSQDSNRTSFKERLLSWTRQFVFVSLLTIVSTVAIVSIVNILFPDYFDSPSWIDFKPNTEE